MIRDICKDEAFLAQKAEPAAADDLGTAQDLLDTLIAHKDGCVGMAANMIGVNKRIIAFENDGKYEVMFNPVIVKQSGAELAGAGIVIEKGFQVGGKTIRDMGVKLESLAIVDSMDNGTITFRD